MGVWVIRKISGQISDSINFCHYIKCALDSFVQITEILALFFQKSGKYCCKHLQAESRRAALKTAVLLFFPLFWGKGLIQERGG